MSDPLDSVAASQLATAAILASLVATLARKGVLTDREVKETYESALLMIEEGQGASPEAELPFTAAQPDSTRSRSGIMYLTNPIQHL